MRAVTSASLGRTVAEPARRRSRMRRGAVTALLLSALMGGLTGCGGCCPGLTVEQIPLRPPGGIGDSIRLTANFDNA